MKELILIVSNLLILSAGAAAPLQCQAIIGKMVNAPATVEEFNQFFYESIQPLVIKNAPFLLSQFNTLGWDANDLVQEMYLQCLRLHNSGKLQLNKINENFVINMARWLLGHRQSYSYNHGGTLATSLDKEHSEFPEQSLKDLIPDENIGQHPVELAETQFFAQDIKRLLGVLQHRHIVMHVPLEHLYRTDESTWLIMRAIVDLSAANKLSPRDVQMIFEHYFEGQTWEAIGQEWHVHRTRVGKILKLATQKVKWHVVQTTRKKVH